MNLDLNVLLSGLLSGLIGVIGTYIILKKVVNNMISDTIEDLLDFETLGKDDKFQQFIYSIGGLIGKGARQGIGMDRKLKPQDVITNMAVQWWENRQRRNNPDRPTESRSERDPLSIT